MKESPGFGGVRLGRFRGGEKYLLLCETDRIYTQDMYELEAVIPTLLLTDFDQIIPLPCQSPHCIRDCLAIHL